MCFGERLDGACINVHMVHFDRQAGWMGFKQHRDRREMEEEGWAATGDDQGLLTVQFSFTF